MAPAYLVETPNNPNEHLLIPKWINEDYFQPILEADVSNYVRILNFYTTAATLPGENYTSVMVRVTMVLELQDGSTNETSYILKTCLDASTTGAGLVNSMNLFPKEMQMYQTLLPKFENLYKEADGGDVKLGPKCLHIEETPDRTTLIMEDLRKRNFVNVNRLEGFDMPHIRAVLRKLAELHAASAVHCALNGPYDEIYHISFFNESQRPLYEALGEARKKIFVQAMRVWGLEDIDKYINKMPTLTQTFNAMMRLNSFDPDEFNVLNHGDCWSNNVMFNYKQNGDIDEVLFVDFQVGKWGSPAQDLWYLIINSAAYDIRINEFDNFIRIYHERLVECLKLLQYSKAIPTLKDMHIQMLKYGYWGPFTANGVMCVILFPTDKDANMETMLKSGQEGDDFRYKTYVNPNYTKAIRQLYPFFENKGLFDDIE